MVIVLVGTLKTVRKKIGKKTGTVKNQRKNQDHSDYNIVKVCQNTGKSPGDLL